MNGTEPTAWDILAIFVGIPFGWALIWAFIVAIAKWRDKR